jgi:hypothetical protein
VKEETALARPEPTMIELRQQLAVARVELVKSAAALKQDLTPLAKLKQLAAKHPYVALGTAFAIGYFIGRRKK